MANEELTKQLASKLADANLSDDEALHLLSLMGGSSGDDVEGFSLDKSSTKLGFNIGMPPRNDPDKWIDVLSTDWGMKAPDQRIMFET